MKKIVAFVSGLALAGCVNSAYQDKEIQIVEEPAGSVILSEPAQPVLPTPVVAEPVASQTIIPQQPVAMPQPNVIEIPAQKLYITDDGTVFPESAVQPAPTVAMPVMPAQPIAVPTEPVAPVIAPQPVAMPQPVVPVYQPQEVMITLQSQTYPAQYTQCSSFDNACMNAALAQGYLPLQYAPQFAGFQNVLGPTDYPAGGRWRNSNNIPRW